MNQQKDLSKEFAVEQLADLENLSLEFTNRTENIVNCYPPRMFLKVIFLRTIVSYQACVPIVDYSFGPIIVWNPDSGL